MGFHHVPKRGPSMGHFEFSDSAFAYCKVIFYSLGLTILHLLGNKLNSCLCFLGIWKANPSEA